MLFQALLKGFLALSQAQYWEELISSIVVGVWTTGNPFPSVSRIPTSFSSVMFLRMWAGGEMRWWQVPLNVSKMISDCLRLGHQSKLFSFSFIYQYFDHLKIKVSGQWLYMSDTTLISLENERSCRVFNKQVQLTVIKLQFLLHFLLVYLLYMTIILVFCSSLGIKLSF